MIMLQLPDVFTRRWNNHRIQHAINCDKAPKSDKGPFKKMSSARNRQFVPPPLHLLSTFGCYSVSNLYLPSKSTMPRKPVPLSAAGRTAMLGTYLMEFVSDSEILSRETGMSSSRQWSIYRPPHSWDICLQLSPTSG